MEDCNWERIFYGHYRSATSYCRYLIISDIGSVCRYIDPILEIVPWNIRSRERKYGSESSRERIGEGLSPQGSELIGEQKGILTSLLDAAIPILKIEQ